MDHRWSPRKPVKMDVFINYQPLGLIRGEARDVSLEGMFVETGCVALPKNEAIDVTFILEHENQKRVLQVGAFVVHTSNKGAGLMFRDRLSSTQDVWESVISDKAERQYKVS